MEMKFDPMTGEPIKRFDPMTGEPLEEKREEESVRRFDPMTGEPLEEKREEEPVRRFDPMTGNLISERKTGGNRWLKIVGGIVAALVVLVVLAVHFVPRFVYGSNYIVLQAAANLFQKNHLAENLNFADIIESGQYTVTANGEFENVEMNVTYARNASAKKVSLEGNASYQGVDVGFTAGIDGGKILLYIPGLSSSTFYYSYVDEKDGYIVDLLRQSGIDIDDLDQVLRQVIDTDKSEQEKNLKNALAEMLDLLDFKKSGKRNVQIDGKSRGCQGYSMRIDEDMLEKMLEIVEDAVDREMVESLGLKSMFSRLYDEIEDMEIDVSVYVYKKQLAAIVLTYEGDDVEVEFHGGSTPWENMTVEADRDTVMELTGSVNDNVEKAELSILGNTVMEYSYNYKTGDLEFDLGTGYERVSLEGNVLKSSKGCTISLDRVSAGGSRMDVALKGAVKKGANPVTVDEKDAIDIGNISEDEWQEILVDKLYMADSSVF